MKANKYTLLGIGLILATGIYLNIKDTADRIEQTNAAKIKPPNTISSDSYRTIKSYDFENGGYHNYSDEEIRIFREKQSYKSDGGYIYTPGRHVPSREEEMEDYIRDNPELIEGALDRY